MMRALYSAFMMLAQPLLRRRLARRGVAEPGYLDAVEERFGRYTQPAGAGFVWVHAVSLGETRAAAILLAQLRAQMPGMRLLLTHGTATGRAEGIRLLQPGDVQVWQPWDTPGAVQRFLDHFQPNVGVLIETEVWPNMVAACQVRRLPLLLVNARLSEKSLRAAKRLAWLARPAFAGLAAVYAQTEADAARLRQLGANVQGVLGNIKFDAQPDAAQLARGLAWRATLTKPVLLFASSREGEEALLLGQLAQHKGSEAVQWMIVPRHPQRFDEVAALIGKHGFAVSRRSSWADAPPSAADAKTIWLGDSLGEMAVYYGLASAALLGGSFEKLGGQNLIEAAACGCPVIMGPHIFNFAEAAESTLAAQVAFGVADIPAAVVAAGQLVGDAQELARAQSASGAFIRQSAGAAQDTAQHIVWLAASNA